MPTTTHCEPKRAAQSIDELRIREGGGVHRDFLRSGVQHGFGIGYRAYAACDAERNIEYARDRRTQSKSTERPSGLAVMS
jgi:hypothetical protein